MSWLDLLLKSTEELEAPERWFWWSGLAAIAAVARKNVWIDRGGAYKQYPNIYVALISAKSGARKSMPISVCKRVLEEVNSTRVISGCTSIQGLIQELGTQRTLENGMVIGEAHGIMISSEFRTFFVTKDPDALPVLTDLYGSYEHEKGWTKTLKNSPPVTLKSPCLTMLIASNEVFFNDVVERKDVEGGFVGRTFVVWEDKQKKSNPLTRRPKNELSISKLAIRLIQISTIKGEFQWTDEGMDLYERWYEALDDALRAGEINDPTGTCGRLGDHVVKVAMLLSLARQDKLVLEPEDIQLAIDKCEECAGTTIKISPTIHSNDSSNGGIKVDYMKLVLECIFSTRPRFSITKAEMLYRLSSYRVFTDGIDPCLNRLIASNFLSKRVIPGSGHINERTILEFTVEGIAALDTEARSHFRMRRV